MYNHPSVQESLKKLENWGTKILPCGEGEMACGTKGIGRLLEPADAFKIIQETLK